MAIEQISDPCDGWPYRFGWMSPGYGYAADRALPLSIEDFPIKPVDPVLAKFMPYVRTDFARYRHDLDWTLESGPDEAPDSTDIVVPYNYSGATSDFFAGGCWNPGDGAEVDIGVPWFTGPDGKRCEVNLTEAEQERIEQHIYENPPEPDYDYD